MSSSFTSPVFAHVLLVLLWPPILPAPDGTFNCVNLLMNVAVSQLFYACPLYRSGHLVHTSNACMLHREQAESRNSETTAVQVKMSRCLQSQWPINHQSSPKTQGDTTEPRMALATVRTKGCWHVHYLTIVYYPTGAFIHIPSFSCKHPFFSPPHSQRTALIAVALRNSIECRHLGRMNRCLQQVQC